MRTGQVLVAKNSATVTHNVFVIGGDENPNKNTTVPPGKSLEIDSRPSDAIALALRTKSPIYVAKKVLEASSELHESQGEPQASDQNLASVSRDKWSEILERMSPEDFKYKM